MAITTGLMEIFLGDYQLKEAQKLSGMPRPTYKIPQSLLDMVSNAEMMAGLQKMPGQGVAEQRLAGTSAAGVRQATELGGQASALGSLADIYGGERQALNELSVMNAQFWTSNQGQLQDALMKQAEAEDKRWQFNEMLPFYEAMAAAARLKEAGTENIAGGMTGIEDFIVDIIGSSGDEGGGSSSGIGSLIGMFL